MTDSLRTRLAILLLISAVPSTATAKAKPKPRPRVREAGIRIGVLTPGKWNAITDVAGVKVGHHTLNGKPGLRTGVTAILPHGGNVFQQKVAAAMAVGNGFGKLVGVTQVRELGVIETPILLTNTLSTFRVADALVEYVLKQKGNESVRSVNPIVGECNDGYLNDVRGRHITARHVHAALAAAKSGRVDEGCVGAGTGTRCMGWKGGIGTSSRKLSAKRGGYTIGVMVQTNFNGILNIAGAPVGKELGRYYLKSGGGRTKPLDKGSCIVVVATDAPVDARQLKRLAKRALLGLAEVGSPMTHGSGDYAIAFSTHPGVRTLNSDKKSTTKRTVLRDDRLSPLFQAAKEATAESVLNSLFRATTTVGYKGRKVEALPLPRVLDICRKYRVLKRD